RRRGARAGLISPAALRGPGPAATLAPARPAALPLVSGSSRRRPPAPLRLAPISPAQRAVRTSATIRSASRRSGCVAESGDDAPAPPEGGAAATSTREGDEAGVIAPSSPHFCNGRRSVEPSPSREGDETGFIAPSFPHFCNAGRVGRASGRVGRASG